MILKRVTDSSSINSSQTNYSLALTSSPFKNSYDTTMDDGYWIIQKLSSDKSVETDKIRDNPIQIWKI